MSAGQAPGVADSFASALWIVDALFNMARVGVDGVNIHTFPSATYELFHFRRTQGRWQGFVSPEYYGMLMFAQAAPLGSRLLTSFTATGGAIKAWATYTPDRTIRVVLINDHSLRTNCRAPGGRAHGPGYPRAPAGAEHPFSHRRNAGWTNLRLTNGHRRARRPANAHRRATRQPQVPRQPSSDERRDADDPLSASGRARARWCRSAK